jgi:hypothetical protein
VLDRPADLAQDETTTLAVLQHIVSCKSCDAVVVLQPTSPLRNADTIDNCVSEFQNGGYDTLATGSYTKIIEYGTHQNLRCQDIPGFFYDDGNVYITASGDELKRFNARDGMGIARIKKAGISTAIITSENTEIVNRRARTMRSYYREPLRVMEKRLIKTPFLR